MVEPRIGVYICHCGTNIAGVVNVDEVAEFSKGLPNTVLVKHYRYMPEQERYFDPVSQNYIFKKDQYYQ